MLQRYLRDCVHWVCKGDDDSSTTDTYSVYQTGIPFEDIIDAQNVVYMPKQSTPVQIIDYNSQHAMDSLQFYYLYGSCSEASEEDCKRESKQQQQQVQKERIQKENQDVEAARKGVERDMRKYMSVRPIDVQNVRNACAAAEKAVKNALQIKCDNREADEKLKVVEVKIEKEVEKIKNVDQGGDQRKSGESQNTEKRKSADSSNSLSRSKSFNLLAKRYLRSDSRRNLLNNNTLSVKPSVPPIMESKTTDDIKYIPPSQSPVSPIDQFQQEKEDRKAFSRQYPSPHRREKLFRSSTFTSGKQLPEPSQRECKDALNKLAVKNLIARFESVKN
eukprot:TRINITY_DN136_c5_g1_i2.p1 TRINITY_DN136_c5_g1~~TRINITY_DN136_c5_g1_i2.p1  ORF type:complete len:332 (-),score=53.19 TRINITY_DN136_c5_g1_i2:147-1142(-)